MQLVTFRADASLRLGAGHVARCLTLADELRRAGAVCHFICREQPGDLTQEILRRGFSVHRLATAGVEQPSEDRDAHDTRSILLELAASAVVVDHYSLGERWERTVRSPALRMVVIDDLADRSHDCDVLIDQNLGRADEDYASLVPPGCRILAGTQYALLRREFAEWRTRSLARRTPARLSRLLISLGGVDAVNAAGSSLAALQHSSLPSDCRITVALGPDAPWYEDVRRRAGQLPWATDVVVNSNSMAEIMANSDLAIGAAGGSAWERCCLGLPTLLVSVAENQRAGAVALAKANAAVALGEPIDLLETLPPALTAAALPARLAELGLAASRLVDGLGAERVRGTIGALLGQP